MVVYVDSVNQEMREWHSPLAWLSPKETTTCPKLTHYNLFAGQHRETGTIHNYFAATGVRVATL
ncbi:MAG: hypothetical protein M2R45_01414 [Verrucomicrobia subdivision 3 bacterium]|nr:hypothetical protein [Limisphaerales bacterium]MCS1415971.1 hypothetical protein [Limisphaerales bacterium]